MVIATDTKRGIVEQRAVLSSDGSKLYTVTHRMDGSWQCSCPGWIHHVPRRDCKHIRAIKTE